MPSQISDLVAMRDIETLFDLMENDDDWMIQLDAAEGLVRLGERGGLEFLESATQSDAREVRDYAREILRDPEVKRKVEDLVAEEKYRLAQKIKGAQARVQKGRKVFIYKSLFLPLGEMLGDSPDGEAVDIPALDDVGLEGWEVVNFILKRGSLLVSNADQHFTGAHFILRKEITADDIAELDTL
ncbi:MAG: hypothetical protein AB1750_18940 [Chloroflexota bacterium]